MTAQMQKMILKQRLHCELPHPNGQHRCSRRSTQVLELAGRRETHFFYTVVACDECARYVRAEQHKHAA